MDFYSVPKQSCYLYTNTLNNEAFKTFWKSRIFRLQAFSPFDSILPFTGDIPAF